VPIWIYAAAAAAAYFVVSLIIGDRFPFSRYAMYARERGRKTGAVPVFLADGKPVWVDSLVRFRFDADKIHTRTVPCSLEWQVHEMRRWVASHQAPEDAGDGPVRLQFGFRMLSIDDGGRITEKVRIVAEGSAWRST
jgi:hypothetical protein